MRISKSNHLKRLLQTQDVLIGTLVYVATIDVLMLIGRLGVDEALAHLLLTPLVLLCCAAASMTREPRLHGETALSLVRFSARYTLISISGVLALLFFAQLALVAPVTLVAFATALFLALLVNRLLLRAWYFKTRREHPSNYLKIIVIGSGNRAQALARSYRERSEWGIEVIGMLDPDPARAGSNVDGIPVLGGPGAIRELLATQVVDEVIVCVPRSLIGEVGAVIDACAEEGVCIKFLADFYDMPSGQVSLESIGSQPVLSFEPFGHDEWKLVIKRIFDLLVAMPAVLVLLPVFAIVAVCIRFDSPGPVFFVQKRVGLNKRLFPLIKFRSMYVDAEARLADIEHLNEAQGPIFKMANDPRITRVGAFLRRTSIDELPQLFNVLLGHLSLVGPRPMSLRDVNLFSQGVQRKRFSVRPGLACLREISGRSQLTFERWLELDLQYIEEWSLWLDLKILVKLIPSVLKGEGAS